MEVELVDGGRVLVVSFLLAVKGYLCACVPVFVCGLFPVTFSAERGGV